MCPAHLPFCSDSKMNLILRCDKFYCPLQQRWAHGVERIAKFNTPRNFLKEAFPFWKKIKEDSVDLQQFWNYKGSLTTPPCLPIVTWIVMKNPLHINQNFVRKKICNDKAKIKFLVFVLTSFCEWTLSDLLCFFCWLTT